MLRNLPRESAYAAALAPEWAGWTPANDQLATVIDALWAANWQRGNGKADDKPRPSWRPGDVAAAKAVETRRQAKARRWRLRRES